MKTGLIIIDMINGIAVNGSCADFVKEQPVLNNINDLIHLFKTKKLPLYFVRLAFEAEYPDYPKHSKLFNQIKKNNRFILGNDDSEFMKELDVYEQEDNVFNKTATSPFHHSGLLEAIRADQVEHLVFTGLATDNAINIGARFAHDEGFKTTIIADACGANTMETHQSSLKLLEKIVNKITITKEFHLET